MWGTSNERDESKHNHWQPATVVRVYVCGQCSARVCYAHLWPQVCSLFSKLWLCLMQSHHSGIVARRSTENPTDFCILFVFRQLLCSCRHCAMTMCDVDAMKPMDYFDNVWNSKGQNLWLIVNLIYWCHWGAGWWWFLRTTLPERFTDEMIYIVNFDGVTCE